MERKKLKPPKYIDLMLEDWFKVVFERNERLLLLLLQMILPEENISSITLVQGEHRNEDPDGRSVRIDAECVTADGRRFMVEVQRNRQVFFRERTLYYAAYAVRHQLEKGKPAEGRMEYEYAQVYIISLINFRFHREPGRVEYRYHLRRDDRPEEIMTDRLTFIYIEVPNHRRPDDPEATRLDKFCWYLRNATRLKARPDSGGDELFDLLLNSIEFTTFTAEEQERYENTMTTEADVRGYGQYEYSRGVRIGERRGRKEGKEEGRNEGRKEGREEGREEGRKETARNMLALGMGIGIIAKATGLSKEEIEALKA